MPEPGPEEMKERGEHLHHKEQPAMPEMFGGEKGERLKTEWARNSTRAALGVESAKKESLEEEIAKLSSPPLKELLRSYIRLPEQVLQTEEGRSELLEKERFIREELIGKGQLEGKDLKIADKLLAAISRKVEKLPTPERIGVAPTTETVEILTSIHDELKKGHELNQVIAEATQKSARATIPEIKTRSLEEIKAEEGATDEEKQANWLRKRLDQLERLEIPFESYTNTQTLNEIHSVLGELRPELQEEYWARHFLHDYSLAFPGSLDAAKERAGSITMTYLQRLTRLPGVEAAFKEYERRARIERGIYEEMAEGKPVKIESDEKVISAVGGEADEVREQIAKKVEDEARLKDGRAAQRIAERIWHITGRSSYWDAFTRIPEEKEKEDGKKEVTYEPFGGRGSLAGPLWLKRLYNFPAFADLRLKKGFGMLHKYMDLGLRDFWSRSVEKLDVSTKKELEANERWVKSLEEKDISRFKLTEKLAEGDFVRMLIHAGYADETRKLLADPGGFLEQPSWENYTKLLAGFDNFAERKKKKLAEVLEGLIEFNRQRDLRQKSLAKEYFPDWIPWDAETIETFVRNAVSRNLITKEKGEEILSKLIGGKVARAAKKETRFAVLTIGKSVLAGLGEILKSLTR